MILDEALLPALRLPGREVIRRLSTMAAVARSRRDLARLDAAALADVGLDRRTARAELRRPAWDVPATWRD